MKNDFIFAAIGEELGLLGTTAIIISYLLMIGAGLRIANRTERPFEKLLAAGLTTIIGVQAFVIIAGVTRVLPLTGVTLPFVSYGGSSLLANYILLAILMRISDSHGACASVRCRRASRPGASGAGPRRTDATSVIEVCTVNKQLRRLGVGLIVCYAILFAQLNWLHVVKADSLQQRPPQRPRDHPRLHPPARRHPHRRRRRGGPERAVERPLQAASASTRPATCSPASAASSRSSTAPTASSGSTTTCSPARRRSRSCGASPTCSTTT